MYPKLIRKLALRKSQLTAYMEENSMKGKQGDSYGL
jgi:hypothetical protein